MTQYIKLDTNQTSTDMLYFNVNTIRIGSGDLKLVLIGVNNNNKYELNLLEESNISTNLMYLQYMYGQIIIDNGNLSIIKDNYYYYVVDTDDKRLEIGIIYMNRDSGEQISYEHQRNSDEIKSFDRNK